jgi:hypothetical protein
MMHLLKPKPTNASTRKLEFRQCCRALRAISLKNSRFNFGLLIGSLKLMFLVDFG